jgi:hypothetical protein
MRLSRSFARPYGSVLPKNPVGAVSDRDDGTPNRNWLVVESEIGVGDASYSRLFRQSSYGGAAYRMFARSSRSMRLSINGENRIAPVVKRFVDQASGFVVVDLVNEAQ